MADEKLKVVIDFNVKDGELNRTLAKIKAFDAATKKLSSGDRLGDMIKQNGKGLTKFKRSLDDVEKGMKAFGKGVHKFITLALKGAVIEMALMSAAMLGIHALFASGQFLMRAYQGAMQIVSVGVAGLTVALSAASAAIREQQAAMFAYRGKGAAAFGSGMAQTQMGMRNLQSDVDLATLGVEALNKAYGNMSKKMSVAQINASKPMLKSLMDFGSAGQDPAKGLEQVSIVMQTIADKKKSLSQVTAEYKKLGEEAKQSLKGKNIKSKKDFENFLLSGEAAKKGGVTGQFSVVNSTLVNQLKGYMTLIKGQFADQGDEMLAPLKESFAKVFGIVTKDITRIMLAVSSGFGTQTFLDGFVTAVDKVGNFFVKMVRDYLPKSKGMMQGMSDWLTSFRRGWNRVLDYLRPFIEGAKVIERAFSPIWESIKKGASNFGQFNKLLQANEVHVVETGTRVAELIDAISKLFSDVKKIIFSMLPFINDLISGVTMVVKLMSSLFGMVADKGFNQGFAAIFGGLVASKQLSKMQGSFAPKTSVMNPNMMQVTATTVNVNGATGVGPGTTPQATADAAKLSSGQTAAATDLKAASEAALKFKTGGSSSIDKPGKFSELVQPSGSLAGAGAVGDGTIRDLKNYNGGKFRSYVGSARDIERMNNKPHFLERQARNAQRRQQSLDRSQSILKAAETPITSSYADSLSLSPFERGGLSATDAVGHVPGLSKADKRRLAREKLRRGGTRARDVANVAGRGARQGYAGYRGALAFAKSGAIDPETGGYFDPSAERARIDARTDYSKFKKFRAKNKVNRGSTTKFGSKVNKFQKGFGGKMGTGLGLGLASQYAPEEMRGAMALGATVSQIDPLLGLGVAGLGGAMQARSAGAGMAAGAMGGAALGAKFGAQGAVIGALVGGIFGGIKGAMNKGQAIVKEAQASVKKTMASFYTSIGHAASYEYEQNTARLDAGQTLKGKKGAFENIAGNMAAQQEKMRKLVISTTPGLGKLAEAEAFIKSNYGSTSHTAGKAGYTDSQMQSEVKSRYGFEVGNAGNNGQRSQINSQKTDMIGKKGQKANRKILEEFKKDGLLGEISAEDFKKQLAAPAHAIATYLGDSEEGKNLAMIQAQTSKRMEMLTTATGKSGPALEKMAREMGIDLTNAALDFNDVLRKMTDGMVLSSQQLNNALTDIFLSGGDVFKKDREKREATQTINKSARGLGDILAGSGGEGSKIEATNSFMETYYAQMLSAAGGDFGKAFITGQNLLGEGGTAFGAGEEFQGQEKFFTNNPLKQEADKKIKLGIADQYSSQIQGLLGQKGFSGNIDAIKTSIGGMSNAEIETLITDMNTLQTDTKGKGKGAGERNAFKRFGTGDTTGSVEALLKSRGIETKISGTAKGTDADLANSVYDTLAGLKGPIQGMDAAITLFNESAKDFMNGPLKGVPEWWARGLKITGTGDETRLMPGDTSSPRGTRIGDTTTSKLSQTMARHEGMNSQLTGKRQVTSSLRTNNLGSPSSDHATGAAYDLTGQNLGAYSKLVHANGGFAEFHGSMATRHLHVVPGAGNLNSTVAPSGQGVGQVGAPVTNHYNINVNGAKHSPQEIAAEVMSHIRREDKIGRERS